MSNFTEDEIQQLLLPILDSAAGYSRGVGKHLRNPIAIRLPSGRTVDIDIAMPIVGGVGISVRDHADPGHAAVISLRIDMATTSSDIMEAGMSVGMVSGVDRMESGRILKQTESLSVSDQFD